MNKEQYSKKAHEIKERAEMDLRHLASDFCLEHNDVKIGDFFKDHIGTIKVAEIRIAEANLCCVYYGAEYTTKRQPKKNTKHRAAWQCNKAPERSDSF